MATTTSPNMHMIIPGVGSEPGPAYASEINAALLVIDGHTHDGVGLKVPTAGLNINADLPIGNNNVNNARSYRMTNNGVILSGGTDVNQIYTFNGNLYFNNAAGTPVQITNSSALNASNTFYTPRIVSSNIVILASDVYTYYEIDCNSGPIELQLPAANSVTPGRFYIFKDTYGNAHNNNINITADGSDSIDAYTTKTLDRDFQVVTLVCQGDSYWQCDFGVPPMWLANQFGQSGQSTTVFGSTTTINAEGAGALNLGSSSNSVNFNGASYTFGFNSGNTLTSNAATTNIVGANFTVNSTSGSTFNTNAVFNANVTLGNTGGDALTVNATTTFTDEVSITGGHNLTLTGGGGGQVTAAYVQAQDTLYATHNAQFGGGAGDYFHISSTTTFNSPVLFNSTVTTPIQFATNGRVVPRMIFGLGTSSTQTFTVSSGTVLLKDNYLSGVTTWTISNTGAVLGDIIYVVVRAMKDSTSGGGAFIVQNAASTTMLNITPPSSSSFSPPMSASTGAGQQYQFAFDGTNWTRIA